MQREAGCKYKIGFIVIRISVPWSNVVLVSFRAGSWSLLRDMVSVLLKVFNGRSLKSIFFVQILIEVPKKPSETYAIILQEYLFRFPKEKFYDIFLPITPVVNLADLLT